VVEHNLAKVGVEGSNPFARSSFPKMKNSEEYDGRFAATLPAFERLSSRDISKIFDLRATARHVEAGQVNE
jgi:hypothetical protein